MPTHPPAKSEGKPYEVHSGQDGLPCSSGLPSRVQYLQPQHPQIISSHYFDEHEIGASTKDPDLSDYILVACSASLCTRGWFSLVVTAQFWTMGHESDSAKGCILKNVSSE